ncbi:hypothetical protein M514_11982 [Trichuris suis]|uniref:Uncharacterized protein n=1 Tax=Trichuris suis TaxID=68888 RepID=A0A085MUW9_9BILA|nr:hypothetical protein M514_11982 [Trichuris suis]
MAVGECEFVGCHTPSMPWSLGTELFQSVSMEDSNAPHGSSSAIGPFVWPDDVSVCSGLEDGSSACKDLNPSASAGTDDELARRVGSILLTILEDDSSSDTAQHSSCLSDEFRKRLPSECTGSFSPLCGSCLLSGEKSTSPVDKALLSGITGNGSSGPISAMPETFLSDSSSSSLPPVVEQLVRLQMTQTASPSNNGDTWSSSKSSTDCLLSDCFPRRSQIRVTGDDDLKSELVLDTATLKPCVHSSSIHECQQSRHHSSLVPPFETPTHCWSNENRWYSQEHLVAKSGEPPTKGWTSGSAHTWLPVEKDNRDSFCAQTSFDSGICEDISWSVPSHQGPFSGLRSRADYGSAAVEMPFHQFVNHNLDYGIRPLLCTPSTTMLNVRSDDWTWQEGYRTRGLSPPTLASNNWTGIPFCCEFPPFFPQPWLQMTSCSRPLMPNAKLIRQTEADLARNNLGKKINSSNNLPIPRLPPAPTKIDRMVVDFFREHARVVTLLQKMEWLRSEPLNSVIVEAIRSWFYTIRAVHVYRTHERAYLFYTQGRIRYNEDRGMLQMANLLKMLTRCVRRARAAMACALTLTINRELNSEQQDAVNSFLSSKAPVPMGTAEIKPKLTKGNPTGEEKADVQAKVLSSSATKGTSENASL